MYMIHSSWLTSRIFSCIGYIGFAILQLPVAEAHGITTIFAFRFLQGVFGAAPSAILSGTLADIWTPKQRGFAMPATGTFLMIGPILGPIVSPFFGVVTMNNL
jgi:MFS family permease